MVGTRDRILEALKVVLVTCGSAGATLDAVAAEAGVSKGGLLYHFPSKEALFSGLMAQLLAESAAILERVAGEPGGVARAYFEASAPTTPDERALHWSILAALRSTDGAREAPTGALRDMFEFWAGPLRASIADPLLAETVRLVGDGIFLNALLGIPSPEPDLQRRVLESLLAAVVAAEQPDPAEEPRAPDEPVSGRHPGTPGASG